MGLFDNLLEAVTSKEGKESLMDGAISILENVHSEKRILKNSTAEYRLKIKRKNNSLHFVVCDEYDHGRFHIKQAVFQIGQPCIELYDADSNKVGAVKREKEWLSSHFSYAVYAGDKYLTSLDYRASAKMRYDIGINGWTLESSLLQSHYTVTDLKGNQIIKINTTTEDRELYIVEYNGKENEIISVLIFMAVMLINKE
ncbi:MAG: hypothetical protein NC432_08885 [Roseburia sp.]|nr:hypothetical protein [Roseburia sp.]MCM1099431.1 hypothetical protein [Ruminococcus flavefaciens]